jgi:hypothetical protein
MMDNGTLFILRVFNGVSLLVLLGVGIYLMYIVILSLFGDIHPQGLVLIIPVFIIFALSLIPLWAIRKLKNSHSDLFGWSITLSILFVGAIIVAVFLR